jgi:hypothetical protein
MHPVKGASSRVLLVLCNGAKGSVIVSRHASIVNYYPVVQLCADATFNDIPATIALHAGAVTIPEQFKFHCLLHI